MTGSFVASLVVAPMVVGVLGAAFEWVFLRRLYKRGDGGAYLLLTFGIGRGAERGDPHRLGAAPRKRRDSRFSAWHRLVLNQPFPLYRMFLIGLGSGPGSRSGSFSNAPGAGLLIRAVSQNSEMVHALGTDVDLVRTAVFGLGCAMAAVGGVLAAPLVTAFLGMGTTVVIDAFVIVIIGGMGSFLGSIIGSLLVGFVQVFGAYYFQDLALAFMYFLMLVVLVIRPGGLLGKEE